MTRTQLGWFVGALLAWSAVAAPAAAQDDASRATARRMATAGVEALQRDDAATAVDKLQRAYEILKIPSVGLWLARALVKQGHPVAASERYLEVGRLPIDQGEVAVQQAAQKDAVAELEALTPKLPVVVVSLDGAQARDVKLTLDGAPLASVFVGEERPIDPGKHRIEGRRGDEAVAVDVVIGAAEKRAVQLHFGPAAPSAPVASTPGAAAAAPPAASTSADTAKPGTSTRTLLAWSAIGLGAAGIVTGSVTGALAIGTKGQLDDSGACQGHQCDRSKVQSELDSYGLLRTVSSVGFIAGTVLAAGGVVLLVTEPSASAAAQATWRLRVSAGAAFAEGTF